MKIVIDTNVIISALIRDSITRKIIISSEMFNFFYPEDGIEEIMEHDLLRMNHHISSKNICSSGHQKHKFVTDVSD